VRHLLGVLSDAGRDDLAITVLTRRTRPGWGAWSRDGETTLLESWDVDARSRNHYFLGSVSAWIQQRVGGLRLTEPGWRRFEVAPVEDHRVTRARIRHRTPLGDAGVSWERGAGGWRFEVTVPDGALAQLRCSSGEQELSAGHHVIRLPR
jgi:alpha-L-rhamnosidase